MKPAFPHFNISYRFTRVWFRNLMVYRKIWMVNFLTPLLEPFFYLLAFGVGLGPLVGKITYLGTELSYTQFIAPSILAINMMYNSFFETTYGSFVRMYYQKTFDAMLATPVCLEEVITAEIVWGATKSAIATCIMLAVIGLFGLVRFPAGLLIVPVAFLGGLAFGAAGMLFTGIIPTIDSFNVPNFLFITPMFLFSGTFFPVENLPDWGQNLAAVLPLTHLVALSRKLSLGIIDGSLLAHAAYLLLLSLILWPLSMHAMRRRLIK
jgi:lipooligosaccharide transport system permease protein